MAKGFGGMGGMNMNNLMKQAQRMQRKMEETQAALAEKKIETTSGGGAVKIVITGKKVIESDDVEMLEDLILSAVNEAVRQADEYANSEMSKVTGGMGGGLF